jgi:hypothetical protein
VVANRTAPDERTSVKARKGTFYCQYIAEKYFKKVEKLGHQRTEVTKTPQKRAEIRNPLESGLEIE